MPPSTSPPKQSGSALLPHFENPPFFFDQGRFRQAIASQNRITVFKDAISAANAQFDHRFTEGEDIRTLIYERAIFLDCILHYAWHQFTWDDNISLIAVGGYGRGELHPHSDIDLLILQTTEGLNTHKDSLENFITLLWDIGLDIGHSVRSIHQCLDIARKDITVATNLFESRTIIGREDIRQQLLDGTAPENMWPAEKFFKAKLDEQKSRHGKHNFTAYNLEPNIKNAPGGLRDIQTIAWVAKRYFGVRTLRQLEGKGFFTDEEYAILRTGEEFLWKVRYSLHTIAGRAEERLLFEYQQDLAKTFGYHDTDRSLAVEQFMHWYYRIVMALRELNEVLMKFLDEVILQIGNNKSVTPINERFQLRGSDIEVTHVKLFQEQPSTLLELFVLMGYDENITGVRASTIRLLREHRDLIDDDFRQEPNNRKLFMKLLHCPNDLVTQLQRMKGYGLLGRYLPEFDRVTGQMQHDLFHIYTVDAHTLLVMKFMLDFRLASAKEKFPVAFHAMAQLPKPELLYIAGLYHDIAKGRGGDHSQLGAVDAQEFCENHGLSRRETRLICWLVEKHLLMSSVSQKQDIMDPEVIHNFALEIGDQLHLNYLYALTVADMNATNPNIWNSWRASLLRQLYLETKRALRRGLENTVDKHDAIEETQEAALRKLQRQGINEQEVRKLWGDMGEDYFLRESTQDIVWQSAALSGHTEGQPLVLVDTPSHSRYEGATQIYLRSKDRPYIFAAMANCLDQLNLSIQDARVYRSNSGFTTDTFYVLDEQGVPIGDDQERLQRIKTALEYELSLNEDFSTIVQRRTPRQLKHFSLPTRTSIRNDIISGYTMLEVISPDRPGLLASIGRIFIRFNILLQNAKISTLGERVEDIFYITDHHGQPLSDPAVCEQLQEDICSQLDRRVENDNAQ